jgi:hypothetical protein
MSWVFALPRNCSIVVNDDNGASKQPPHPPNACARFGSRGIPRQGLSRDTLLFQDRPDGRPVFCRRPAYHHVARITRPRTYVLPCAAPCIQRSL